jgi:flavin reductase (DIM6/NTAB) family NADH-FMN oxidoreductase RutF
VPPIDTAALPTAEAAAPSEPAFTPRHFRNAMGQFATGVVVIATEHEGHAHAMTANAFMSGSLEPPLVLVSVACTARMHSKIRDAGHFSISMLAEHQLAVSNHFAGKPMPGHQPVFERLHGLPVVRGATLQLAASLEHAYACGDHTLFVGRAMALQGPVDAPPLLFHGGRYSQLRGSDSGDTRVPDGFCTSHEQLW